MKKPKIDSDIRSVLILFVLTILFFGIAKDWALFKPMMVKNMLKQMPEYGIIALGIMITRISGRIDLSVIGTANLSAIVSAIYMRSNLESGKNITAVIVTAFLIALAVGLACGLVNSFLIHNLELPSFVTTIGTGTLFSGIGVILTKGTTFSNLPAEFIDIFATTFGIFPLSVFLYIFAALILGFALYKTRFGLSLYLSGTNSKASRFAGVNEGEIVYKSYLISALMSVIGGLIMMARFNSVNAANGNTYSLLGILICMIGGISPSGGNGRVEGVVLATLIMQLISSGMSLFHSVNSYYNKLVYGGLLLIFMVINFYSRKNKEKKLNAKAG